MKSKEAEEKRKAVCQLNNLRLHCIEMSNRNYGKSWGKEAAALDVAIECLNNDRNEMIINDIKRIIKRYDEMNLNVSFEERKENHIKAYMEIKDYFNNCTAEDKKEWNTQSKGKIRILRKLQIVKNLKIKNLRSFVLKN